MRISLGYIIYSAKTSKIVSRQESLAEAKRLLPLFGAECRLAVVANYDTLKRFAGKAYASDALIIKEVAP